MNNEFYDDSSMSLNQALAIAKEEDKPSRKFSHKMPDIELLRTDAELSQGSSPISSISVRVPCKTGNEALETRQGQQ